MGARERCRRVYEGGEKVAREEKASRVGRVFVDERQDEQKLNQVTRGKINAPCHVAQQWAILL